MQKLKSTMKYYECKMQQKNCPLELPPWALEGPYKAMLDEI